MRNFEPTLEAAHARLAAVNPEAYARTRNALDGAVTRLSPYLTHGLLTLREVFDAVQARHPLDAQHKFVFELGWRAYYQHVWAHLGDGIHQSIHTGLRPDDDYRSDMPADVLEARTGIPAIDLAVRELYDTGYVHNHARMWLASYIVHLRKVHWHAGAQWHSPGTVVDTSYEALDRIARSATPIRPHNIGAAKGIPQPDLHAAPPDAEWSAPDGTLVSGRDVWLIHPWSLGAVPQPPPLNGALVIGVGVAQAHKQMPWSARRWRFVTQGLQARTPHLWWGSTAQVAEALGTAQSVTWQPDLHMPITLQGAREQSPTPLFEAVETYCPSFAKWWRRTRPAV